MAFGDLLQYPLNPAVWGTVAAWVGAVGSSAAFLLAAQVYRRDSKLHRYEQAIMVRFEETSAPAVAIAAMNPENLVLEVHNTSDRAIYSVSGHLYSRSLYEIASDGMSFGPAADPQRVDEESLRSSLFYYRQASGHIWPSPRTDRIAPGESAEFKFVVPYTFHHRLSIHSTDARNQNWQLSTSRQTTITGEPPKLEYVGDFQARFIRKIVRRSLLIAPPHRTVYYFWTKARLRIWAMRNSPWGPGVNGWKQMTPEFSPRSHLIRDKPGEPIEFDFLDMDYSQNAPSPFKWAHPWDSEELQDQDALEDGD